MTGVSAQTSCLILGNGIIGAEKQALALANRLHLPYTLRRVLPRKPLAALPTDLLLRMPRGIVLDSGDQRCLTRDGSYPDVVISCGRASIPASVAMRQDTAGSALMVHVQRPTCSERWFDLVIAPRHDYTASDPPPSNVLLTRGSLHDVDATTLASAHAAWAPTFASMPTPRLALLIGGRMSRRWWHAPLAPVLTVGSATRLVRSAAETVAASGGSLLVTTSRRTPAEVAAAIDSQLDAAVAAGVPCQRWWADAAPNPYLGLLACADHLLVTADSVNMVTEACGTGKPVYVFEPHQCRGRFASFHKELLEAYRTRAWRGHGTLEPSHLWNGVVGIGDAQYAAKCVHELLSARQNMATPKQ